VFCLKAAVYRFRSNAKDGEKMRGFVLCDGVRVVTVYHLQAQPFGDSAS
jgi:hypothetical protein